jgi:DNA-binding NarL/FixJ family response regulator
VSGEGARPRVVVAHGEEAIREAAMRVTRAAGFDAVGVSDGESARLLLLASRPVPAALVVDVALPGVLGYQLAEEVGRARLPTRVILVASVYSKTAYKRRPSSLYGADDYVEQHHVVDQLGPKLERAVADARAVGAEALAHAPHVLSPEAVAIRDAGEQRLAFRYQDPAQAEERARNLARLIVADLMLYAGDDVQAWAAAGAAGPLPQGLARDLDEGRRLFALRVPAEIAATRDYLLEALRDAVPGRTAE